MQVYANLSLDQLVQVFSFSPEERALWTKLYCLAQDSFLWELGQNDPDILRSLNYLFTVTPKLAKAWALVSSGLGSYPNPDDFEHDGFVPLTKAAKVMSYFYLQSPEKEVNEAIGRLVRSGELRLFAV